MVGFRFFSHEKTSLNIILRSVCFCHAGEKLWGVQRNDVEVSLFTSLEDMSTEYRYLTEDIDKVRTQLHSQGIVPRVVMKDLYRIKCLRFDKKCVYQAPEHWEELESRTGVEAGRVEAASALLASAAWHPSPPEIGRFRHPEKFWNFWDFS